MAGIPFDISASAFAIGTALAGVVLYGAAARLPSPVSPPVLRGLGLWLVGTSSLMVWAVNDAWQPAAILCGLGVLAVLAVHLVQTRRPAPAAEATENGEPADSNS